MVLIENFYNMPLLESSDVLISVENVLRIERHF